MRMELSRKRREAEALEFLLGVSQEVEKRRASECGEEHHKSEVANA